MKMTKADQEEMRTLQDLLGCPSCYYHDPTAYKHMRPCCQKMHRTGEIPGAKISPTCADRKNRTIYG